jgi:AcrR family transcriptional regulator
VAVRSPRTDGRFTDMRQRIEATALRMFAERGYSATSLQNIADDLGITKAAVYYHFPAKSDLARAVFRPFIDDVDALLTRVDAEQPGPRAILTGFVDALLPHRDVFAAMLRDPSGLREIDVEGASLRWLDRLPAALLGREPTPADRIRATVALGGLTRVVLLPGIPSAELRQVGVESALAALRG